MVNRSIVVLSLLNIAMFGCSVAFVWSAAQTQYGIAKPWILEFTPTEPVIKLEHFSLGEGYNADTNTYKMIKISLKNYGETAIGAAIALVIFDKDMAKICEGTAPTPMIAPGGTYDLEVPLVWIPGADVLDITLTRIAVQEYRVS